MAIKTFEELRTLAILVRDEKLNRANSANRIGSLMIEQINKIEESYNHFPESDYKDLKNHVATITKAANYEVLEYQVSIATTRLKVPEENRKGGYMITYDPGTGWIKEQYIGDLTTDEEWIKDENWKAEILNDSIQAIAENALQQANLAATNAALAEEKATEAATQAAYAKEQGDLAATRGGVPEAPSDNKQYARKNKGWEEVNNIGEIDQESDGTGVILGTSSSASARGKNAVAFGSGFASGEGSFAGGALDYGSVNATGRGSFAHGCGDYDIYATGDGAVAIGLAYGSTDYELEASGDGSVAMGHSTKALSYGQVAIGSCNERESDPSPKSFNAEKIAFVIGNDTYWVGSNAFKVLFNGQTYADGQYSSSGADYAEMFEWKDGNPLNEDRVGRLVTLIGKNIEIADETSTYILGIVSGAPTIIGDDPMRWHNKYLNDEWGRPIYEDVEFKYTETVKQEDGTLNQVEKTRIDHVRKLNPQYKAKEKYIPRAERKEWDYIGMMGKLLVRQDGTLTEGGLCKPSANGVATTAESGYYVMDIINESQALILFR